MHGAYIAIKKEAWNMSNENSGWNKIAEQDKQGADKAKRTETLKNAARVADHITGVFARVMIAVVCILLLAAVYLITSRM